MKSDKVVPIAPDYTPSELAHEWNLSPDCIRSLFRHEPGVVVIDRPETRFKRGYSTIRIPRDVAARVRARMTNKGRSSGDSDALAA